MGLGFGWHRLNEKGSSGSAWTFWCGLSFRILLHLDLGVVEILLSLSLVRIQAITEMLCLHVALNADNGTKEFPAVWPEALVHDFNRVLSLPWCWFIQQEGIRVSLKALIHVGSAEDLAGVLWASFGVGWGRSGDPTAGAPMPTGGTAATIRHISTLFPQVTCYLRSWDGVSARWALYNGAAG